ncbi:MAG: hypothetical protein JO169_00770 [Solirubrobacterales bacterium]|nr:hypothetical protein [Solirubrobacterales bacterium]MBV9837923.1 hypothetical protein [Solirubrobacterales bacterium]
MALLKRGVPARRSASLAPMPAAAFAVHQLRYWLAFPGHAGIELAKQGHSYLHSLVPWVALLLATAIGVYLRALGRAWGGKCTLSRYTASFATLWLACAASLVAIYVSQELLEGLLATGHPGGLAGVFGYGGWWSIPASLAVGLVLAAAFHGAHWVLHELAERRAPRVRPACPPAIAQLPPRAVALRLLAPLADGWSGRAPPR